MLTSLREALDAALPDPLGQRWATGISRADGREFTWVAVELRGRIRFEVRWIWRGAWFRKPCLSPPRSVDWRPLEAWRAPTLPCPLAR